jgi:hypothetical protein
VLKLLVLLCVDFRDSAGESVSPDHRGDQFARVRVGRERCIRRTIRGHNRRLIQSSRWLLSRLQSSVQQSSGLAVRRPVAGLKRRHTVSQGQVQSPLCGGGK